MKAVLCRSFGPVEQLSVEDAPTPLCGADQVLIDVRAIGVNFPDGLLVQGKYQAAPAFPFSPGSEVAGVVRLVGANVRAFAAGDRVIAFTGNGGYAERVAVDAARAFKAPEAMAWKVAGGFLITYATAYHALKDQARLRSGETLLVLGAGGGVGLAAVELGAAMGARVVAAASSGDKLALARGAGAQDLIDYSKTDLRAALKETLQGRGVDVVFDPVGGALSEASIRSLAWGGRHLAVGFASGEIPKIPLNLFLLKEASSSGVFWGAWAKAHPAANAANTQDLFDLFSAGKIKPHVSATFPLDRAADAINHVLSRKAHGKVVILPDNRDGA
ncbi:MAG: NADPH:quinone oxidoreductase [Rhizobiales bacterium 65-9]|nr:NADPH:quinone oxidoreductase family protein [Hyphomicrobiales bacterium]OJY39781.1 MAG: NADPH:quinone oxidoreductase [Rhizobiales bacterium 65-9]